MNRFKFGRYLYKKSVIHSLNPLVKLISLAILATVSLFDGGYRHLVLSYAVLLVALFFSSISLKELYLSIRSFRFFFILTFVIQLFFTANGEFMLIPDVGQFIVASIFTLRFVLVISFSALFTLTTTPSDIARGLFFFVKPLKKFNANVSDIAISLLVSVRFIPLMFEESEKIVIAQKLRNGWSDKTSFREKFLFFIKAESFVIPLFVRVIRYAEQISITLHYRKNPEDIMAIPKFVMRDYGVLALTITIAMGIYFV